VTDSTAPLGKRGDRLLVGQVDGLGDDARLVGVGVLERLMIAAGRDQTSGPG
jgi:hypothetical protein